MRTQQWPIRQARAGRFPQVSQVKARGLSFRICAMAVIGLRSTEVSPRPGRYKARRTPPPESLSFLQATPPARRPPPRQAPATHGCCHPSPGQPSGAAVTGPPAPGNPGPRARPQWKPVTPAPPPPIFRTAPGRAGRGGAGAPGSRGGRRGRGGAGRAPSVPHPHASPGARAASPQAPGRVWRSGVRGRAHVRGQACACSEARGVRSRGEGTTGQVQEGGGNPGLTLQGPVRNSWARRGRPAWMHAARCRGLWAWGRGDDSEPVHRLPSSLGANYCQDETGWLETAACLGLQAPPAPASGVSGVTDMMLCPVGCLGHLLGSWRTWGGGGCNPPVVCVQRTETSVRRTTSYKKDLITSFTS